MKKGLNIITLFLLVIFSFTLCKKKEEAPPPASPTTTTTSPTYSPQNTSTTANPCGTCVTVTGTNTTGNTATQNSALTVGAAGWIFNSCNGSDSLVGYNGTTKVLIQFGGPSITTMAYAFTSGIPTAGQARMIVKDAPGQPSGIVWYSKNGTVSVSTGTAGTTATFSNIQCLQMNYLFPVVTASGSLTCN